MAESLTELTAIEYLAQKNLTKKLFGESPNLTATKITEGNVNVLFKISDQDAQKSKSVLVKQALPYSWRYPDFKMPVDRARIEFRVLEVEGKYCPAQVPEVYLFDEDDHIMVMEFFDNHLVMRDGLTQQVEYPKVAEHMGLFLAKTLFYTSDLFLSSGEKKALVPDFINPVLCKIQEDLVFTQPFMEHPNNRWTPALDPLVTEIYANDNLRKEIYKLKERYMSHAQALIHNDIHTGSIMVNEQDTKVIDPEFAFFGPMGHDIGTYLGNLVFGYVVQDFYAHDRSQKTSYQDWILETIRDTWKIFDQEFRSLWDQNGNDEWQSPAFKDYYLLQLLRDSAGFGAAEMFRRLIGMAHVQDFEHIEDEKARAIAESIALNVANNWIMNQSSFTSIDDLISIIHSSEPLKALKE